MKRARLILNIIVILLVVFQLLGYVGTVGKTATEAQGMDLVAFYIGFNLPIIVAVILFLIAQFLKKKMSKQQESNIIDSIGKD